LYSICIDILDSSLYKEPSWSWSYRSWIYNYQCNQCPLPPKLWVRIPLIARCTTCDKACQWLATGRWFSPCTSVLCI